MTLSAWPRVDLHPGEVQALCALVTRSLFDCEQIDANEDLSHSILPVRDDYAVSNRAPATGANTNRRQRMEYGSISKESRKRSPDVWSYRWWESGPNGKRIHRRLVIGSVTRFQD